MKKIVLIAALITITGLTALTVSGKENKAENVKVKIEQAEQMAPLSSVKTLATAD